MTDFTTTDQRIVLRATNLNAEHFAALHDLKGDADYALASKMLSIEEINDESRRN